MPASEEDSWRRLVLRAQARESAEPEPRAGEAHATEPPASRSEGARSAGAPGERDRFRRRVAYLIVLVSILGPIVSWQASEAAQDADDLDQAASQERIRKQQSVVTVHARMAQDLRLLGRAQEREVLAQLLDRHAGRFRPRVPETARALSREARLQAVEGSALLAGFLLLAPTPRSAGSLTYDSQSALRAATELAVDEGDLQPHRTTDRAEDAHDRSANLLRVAAMLVGSLLFLTLAQVTGRGRREGLAVAGVLIAIAGAVLFAAA